MRLNPWLSSSSSLGGVRRHIHGSFLGLLDLWGVLCRYVFEGEITFFGYWGPQMSYANVTLGPGGWLYGPMGRPHRFQNVGNTFARMLSFNIPAGLSELQLAAGDMVRDKLAPIPFTQSAAGAIAYIDYLENDPGENLIIPDDGTFTVKDPPRAADYAFKSKGEIDQLPDMDGPFGSMLKEIAAKSQIGSSTGGAAAVYRVVLPVSSQQFDYISADEYWTYVYVGAGEVDVEVLQVDGIPQTTRATLDDNFTVRPGTQFRLRAVGGEATLLWINVFTDFSYTALPFFGPKEGTFVTDSFFGFPVDPPLPEECNDNKYDGFRCPARRRNAGQCFRATPTDTSLQSTLTVNDNDWSMKLRNFDRRVPDSALGDPTDNTTETLYGVCLYVDDQLLMEFVADASKPWERVVDRRGGGMGFGYEVNFLPRFSIVSGDGRDAGVEVDHQMAMMFPSLASQLQRSCGLEGPARSAQVQVIVPTTDACFDSGDMRFIVNSGSKFRATNM
eukprot:jgi/Mesvir1/25662/Mv01878-RA.1